MVQHANIPDAQLHEPKGAATATAGSIYISNGAGSGTWQKLPASSLKSLTGDAEQSNFKFVSDGSNGFKLIKDIAYVQMGISGNTNAFAVAAASTAALNSVADYVQLTGTGAPWTGGLGQDAGFTTNQINVGVAGNYELSLVATIGTFPTNTASVAFKLRINNSTFVPRKAIAQSSMANAIVQANMTEFVTLAANDTVQVYIASSAAGGVVVADLSLTVKMIKAANG